MRLICLCLVSALVVASSFNAEGQTITGKLVDLNASNLTPGSVHSIAIYLKTDVPNGIASAEMEILSNGTGNVNFGTQSGATPANSTISTFPPIFGYSIVKPSLSVDGLGDTSQWYPKPVIGAAHDGDFDAVGFAVFATPGSVDSLPDDQGAVGQTQTGFGDLVGVEKWVFNGADTLTLYLAYAQYFADDSGGADTANLNYPTANYVGSSVSITVVPEPTSFVLLGLGGLGFVAGAQRRRSTIA